MSELSATCAAKPVVGDETLIHRVDIPLRKCFHCKVYFDNYQIKIVKGTELYFTLITELYNCRGTCRPLCTTMFDVKLPDDTRITSVQSMPHIPNHGDHSIESTIIVVVMTTLRASNGFRSVAAGVIEWNTCVPAEESATLTYTPIVFSRKTLEVPHWSPSLLDNFPDSEKLPVIVLRRVGETALCQIIKTPGDAYNDKYTTEVTIPSPYNESLYHQIGTIVPHHGAVVRPEGNQPAVHFEIPGSAVLYHIPFSEFLHYGQSHSDIARMRVHFNPSHGGVVVILLPSGELVARAMFCPKTIDDDNDDDDARNRKRARLHADEGIRKPVYLVPDQILLTEDKIKCLAGVDGSPELFALTEEGRLLHFSNPYFLQHQLRAGCESRNDYLPSSLSQAKVYQESLSFLKEDLTRLLPKNTEPLEIGDSATWLFTEVRDQSGNTKALVMRTREALQRFVQRDCPNTTVPVSMVLTINKLNEENERVKKYTKCCDHC